MSDKHIPLPICNQFTRAFRKVTVLVFLGSKQAAKIVTMKPKRPVKPASTHVVSSKVSAKQPATSKAAAAAQPVANKAVAAQSVESKTAVTAHPVSNKTEICPKACEAGPTTAVSVELKPPFAMFGHRAKEKQLTHKRTHNVRSPVDVSLLSQSGALCYSATQQ